jgi:hypothetical protein
VANRPTIRVHPRKSVADVVIREIRENPWQTFRRSVFHGGDFVIRGGFREIRENPWQPSDDPCPSAKIRGGFRDP